MVSIRKFTWFLSGIHTIKSLLLIHENDLHKRVSCTPSDICDRSHSALSSNFKAKLQLCTTIELWACSISTIGIRLTFSFVFIGFINEKNCSTNKNYSSFCGIETVFLPRLKICLNFHQMENVQWKKSKDTQILRTDHKCCRNKTQWFS